METQAKNIASSTVLIVDDNETVLDLLDLLLANHGSNVLRAQNGGQCLAIARCEPVDLVILDVMMPGMDGIKVTAELKRTMPSLPIILLTAKDDLATRAAAMALGVNEFVTKPIPNRELLARVRTQLSTRKWELEMERTAASVSQLAGDCAGKFAGKA
jgi:DNA-binding response OmpR family regulator